MKDIIMEKNSKKVLSQFVDLSTGRGDIIKHSSKNVPKCEYPLNEFAKSLHPSKMDVVVSKIIQENENTKSFVFKREDQLLFPIFEAGSYITLEVHTDNRVYKRPYSISSDVNHLDEYQITIKKVENGKVSNYMFDECKENDKFTIYGPFGNFHYNVIRDSSDVVFIAGGNGISCLRPMIIDLLQKKKVATLQLVYGVKTMNDFIWKEELDNLQKKYKNFKVLYLLSEEKRDGYISGVVDEEILLSLEPTRKTFFISGPPAMYETLNQVFIHLDIPNKYIRHEIYKSIPENLKKKKYQLTIYCKDQVFTIPCYENKTLVQSMEEEHIDPPVHCTVGVCGFCRSKLISGTVKTENSLLRKKDIDYKYIHPCVSYPQSDIEIELV